MLSTDFFKKEKIKNQKVFWKVKNGHFKMSKNEKPGGFWPTIF